MTRKRILIVDDEIGSTRLLKANLELTDLYEVRVENRPENAVSAARQFKPDAVLLDIVMPNMLGTAIAEALLGEPELQSTFIAFLTAADNPLLTPNPNPAIARLPRIRKPASMKNILQFLEIYLRLPPVSTAIAPGVPAQPYGGANA